MLGGIFGTVGERLVIDGLGKVFLVGCLDRLDTDYFADHVEHRRGVIDLKTEHLTHHLN